MDDDLRDLLFEGGVLLAWVLIAWIAALNLSLQWWQALIVVFAGHLVTMVCCYAREAMQS